ncbi:MAG: flippase [Acetobacteraceae bacterium]|nr:flippase [Acetobacteraceae bacterium]
MTDPTASPSQAERTGARRLVSGVFWNALGRGLPLLLALALTPVLVHLMGLERWGLFTLALAMVGVFGVFDLGIGPALTRALSERIEHGDRREASRLVGAALAALGGLACLVAAVFWAILPWLVTRALNVPEALQAEALAAFRVLAVAAPLIVVNAALWGVLSAHQRFAAANLATLPVAVMYYVGPVLVLLVWQSLVGVMLALVACRLANTLSYAWLVRRDLPGFGVGRLRDVLPLLRIGGWMTAGSLLNQGLIYADRFLIGAVLTLAAVAHYATPLDLVLRMWILPVAVAQALLPAMAGAFRSDPTATANLLRRGGLIVLALTLPPCLLLAAEGDLLLRLWLGRDFAAEGGAVLRILGAGILFSCMAYAPNVLLEAIGRPDVAAKFLLAQLVVFLPLSALLLWRFGIEGAAVAWALRCAADFSGKLYFAQRLYPAARMAARGLVAPAIAAGVGLAFLLQFQHPGVMAALAAATLAAVLALAWPLLDGDERALLRRPWRARQLLRGRPA